MFALSRPSSKPVCLSSYFERHPPLKCKHNRSNSAVLIKTQVYFQFNTLNRIISMILICLYFFQRIGFGFMFKYFTKYDHFLVFYLMNIANAKGQLLEKGVRAYSRK